MHHYNSTITFKDLRSISNALNRNDYTPLLEFVNSFNGKNTFEKFRSILTCWETDVSYTLDLILNDLPSSVNISYLLSEIPDSFSNSIIIKDKNLEIILDIPKIYSRSIDIIPIYDMIEYINFSNTSINLLDLPLYEKDLIINNLPAKLYNKIFKYIVNDKSKILSFSNPLLDKLKINFLTIEPLTLLIKMFSKYNDDYYRDVIFHLSKRIDGDILMNSTILDIEYYMEKYIDEIKTQNESIKG